jgi:sigma-B regulation protein RsbU (phosphoserine phosphatase)
LHRGEVFEVIELGEISITVPESITDARNKVRQVVEYLSGNQLIAGRLATATSELSRRLLGDSSGMLSFLLDPRSDRTLLLLQVMSRNRIQNLDQILGFFDRHERTTLRNGCDQVQLEADIGIGRKLTGQQIEHLKEIVQRKNRDELMAEITARNEQLKESLDHLRRTRSAKERMEGELSIGRDIQMSMVPAKFPPFPDRNEFSIFAKLIPAREVGGDFYDFFLIDQNLLCFCIGDVSGKGVPAALFMAVTKTLIKSMAKNDAEPASVLTAVNTELSQNNDSAMFVTIFLAMLNLKTGVLNYCNAGHNPPYLKRQDGSIERIDKRHGPVIGAREGLAYKQDSVQLDQGDSFLCYTDGVTEAMSPSDELYSETRLRELLSQSVDQTVESIVDVTVASVREFENGAEQADDITVLCLDFMGQGPENSDKILQLRICNQLDEIERVNSEFNDFCKQNHIADSIRQKMNLVFDELLNNIISYGFEDGQEHEIEIDCRLVGDLLKITITDFGVPFNPFEQPEPDTSKSLQEREIGGLGIHLVRKLVDDVHYERLIDKNVVQIEKST